jgi:hypothetical protein
MFPHHSDGRLAIACMNASHDTNSTLPTGQFQYAWLGLLLLLSAALCGCGDNRVRLPTASVSGTVSYQGRPLTAARITFLHSSGQAAAADVGPDGRFTVSAFQGNNQVAVTCVDADDPQFHHGGRGGAPSKSRIPKKYAEFGQSGLTFEVKPGEDNQAQFTLKD